MQQTQNQPAGAAVADALSTALNTAAQNIRPASVLIGNRKFLAAAGTIGMAVANALFVKYGINAQIPPDATVIDVIIQGLQLAAYYSPSILTYLTTRHYITENVKQDIAHTEAKAQTAAVATPATPAIPTPQVVDPGPAQPAMIAAFNHPAVVAQLNPIKPNIATANLAAMEAITGSEMGVGQTLLDNRGAALQLAYQKYADQSLQPVEAIRKAVEDILGVKMTPQECAAVQANEPLATILHLEHEPSIIGGLITAQQAHLLGPATWAGLQNMALFYKRQIVIDSLNKELESGSKIDAADAMSKLGLSDDTIKSAQPDAGGWRVWLHGKFDILNVAAELGLDPTTYLPI